jgi:type II secretory pathway component PulF
LVLENDEKDPLFKRKLTGLVADLNTGAPFGSSLRNLLPGQIPFNFSFSDEMPRLPVFLSHLRLFYEHREASLQFALKQLAYPVFLLGIVFSIFCFFLFFLTPIYMSFFESFSQTPPVLLRVSADLYPFLESHINLVISGCLGSAIFFYFWGAKLKSSILALFYSQPEADLMWYFSVMLSSGHAIRSIIEHLQKDASLSSDTSHFLSYFHDSGNLSDSLSKAYSLLAFHTELIKNGEMTGTLPEAFMSVAQDLSGQQQRRLSTVTKILQPFFLFLISFLILALMYCTFIPVIESSRIL